MHTCRRACSVALCGACCTADGAGHRRICKRTEKSCTPALKNGKKSAIIKENVKRQVKTVCCRRMRRDSGGGEKVPAENVAGEDRILPESGSVETVSALGKVCELSMSGYFAV